MNPFNEEMSHLDGIRVVRGPDWKWGDQDGGEGNAGTVYTDDYRLFGINKRDLLPGMVFVIWDVTGSTNKYRCGHQGFHDLRVIDNTATGCYHRGISCGDCLIKEIRGTRWVCVTCDTNLCTKCFLKELPHHPDHNQFKRYDGSDIVDAPVVFSWKDDDGPQSRVKLMGIYPGAIVAPAIDRFFFDSDFRIGVVSPNIDADSFGRIYVEWKDFERLTQEVMHHRDLFVQKPVIGGYYQPSAFSVLENVLTVSDDKNGLPKFFPGDFVQIRMEELDGILLVDMNGDRVEKDWVKGVVGSVESVSDSDILAKFTYDNEFKYQKGTLRLNPAHVIKLNEFSINEIIRIKTDDKTIFDIQECSNNIPVKLEGETGRVCASPNPERVHIKFDNEEVNRWYGHVKIPSSWMERSAIHAEIDQELDDMASRTATLLTDAVKRGDLRAIKLLVNRQRVDINAFLFEKMTALHLACKEGQKEIVQFIIDQPDTDLKKRDVFGFCAIHRAVVRCDVEILGMLIKKGAELDSRTSTRSGHFYFSTPLHLALSMRHFECVRLLIHHGCKVNQQITHSLGFKVTTLCYSIYSGLAPEIIKLLVAKCVEDQTNHPNQLGKYIDQRNDDSMTAFLVACKMKDCTVIELLAEAGADTNAVDKEGNTAIIYAISCLKSTTVQEFSPSILKFYQNTQEESNKKFMQEYPILSLLAYLLYHGCSWETVNGFGQKAADILLKKGYPKEVIELLNQTAEQYKRWPFGPRGCMGQNGECAEQPVFRLSCDHKATFRACSGCFPLIFEQHKCGCPDEGVALIKSTQRTQDPADLVVPLIKQEATAASPDEAQNHPEQEEMQPTSSIPILKWIEGPEMGLVVDQMGNTYKWNKQVRKDGSIGYRCSHKIRGPFKEQKCRAIARRYLKTADGPMILLTEPHDHPSSGVKRSFDGGTQSEDGPGPSGAKRSCADGATFQ